MMRPPANPIKKSIRGNQDKNLKYRIMNKHLTKLLFGFLLSIFSSTIIAQQLDITGPAGSGKFGIVTVLSNGNYVVADSAYDDGPIVNVGAVHLYNGITHNLISTLKGSTAYDRIGWIPIVPLSNGNFLVPSPDWDNGGITNAGALTWVNGITGLNGVVSSSNSLVGSSMNDFVGGHIKLLSNGNYVMSCITFDNGAATDAGAVTWGDANTGVSGVVNSLNSLLGTNTDDGIFGSVTPLTNGNYVAAYPGWNGGTGAVIWCNGSTGKTGTISSGDALVGDNATQSVGNAVAALSNGNYVVISHKWNSLSATKVGAVTLGNGATGTTGVVSAGNSLIGSSTDDQVGFDGVVPLPNGNYLVRSRFWDNGAVANAGAVTYCSGTVGTVGVVSAANSLIGSTANDMVGYGVVTQAVPGVIVLSNGNYVVSSPTWDNGGTVNVGAVTWGDGNTGVTGVVSAANSLIGSTAADRVGSGAGHPGIVALTNGNYVVSSPYWINGGLGQAGAATWCNGLTGRVGTVSTANSMVGNKTNDFVSCSGVWPLTNGNYVVATEFWNNGAIFGAGAVTWCDGSAGSFGEVTTANSLVGDNPSDYIGTSVYPLTNGNYYVNGFRWRNGTVNQAGAVTWCNGSTGLVGSVSTANSLVGTALNDFVAFSSSSALTNGNFVASATLWDNTPTVNSGAVTLLNGSAGYVGTINSCISVLGTAAGGGQFMRYAYNYIHDYLLVGRPFDNIVTVFTPTGFSLANDLDNQTITMAGNGEVPLLSGNGCRIIGTVTGNGANPVSGSVTAKAWVKSSVPTHAGEPFVARHYEITPAANAPSATGRITLYFTQPEFSDFNNDPLSALNLPTGPADAIGIANLRIGKFAGVSSDGSGLPGTYPGPASVINPDDVDIVWNAGLSRWEVSFDVTGFSGFIVQTKTSVLPVTSLELNGRLNSNNAVLNWITKGEINTLSFDVERSVDGRNYIAVGNVAALNQPGTNLYTYSDNNITAFGAAVIYYRIKQKDINGRFSYSGIVALSIDKQKNAVRFYPNPVITKADLSVTVNQPGQVVLKIFDNTGRLLVQKQLTVSTGTNVLPVDLVYLAKGLYYLELKGEFINEHISFVKQ